MYTLYTIVINIYTKEQMQTKKNVQTRKSMMEYYFIPLYNLQADVILHNVHDIVNYRTVIIFRMFFVSFAFLFTLVMFRFYQRLSYMYKKKKKNKFSYYWSMFYIFYWTDFSIHFVITKFV